MFSESGIILLFSLMNEDHETNLDEGDDGLMYGDSDKLRMIR